MLKVSDDRVILGVKIDSKMTVEKHLRSVYNSGLPRKERNHSRDWEAILRTLSSSFRGT